MMARSKAKDAELEIDPAKDLLVLFVSNPALGTPLEVDLCVLRVSNPLLAIEAVNVFSEALICVKIAELVIVPA
jgi:precorrin-3B methylase